MRNLQYFISPLLLLCTSVSFAGESIDKSLPLNNVAKVNIENLRGHVEIIGTSDDVITVKGELDEKAEGFIFEQDGSRINIKVKMPRHMNNSWNQEGSELVIHVPAQVKVDFTGVSTDVLVKNFKRSVEIKSVSGDINASDLLEDIELASISGDIRSENLSGKIALSTISGEINDKNSTGRLIIKAVSGEIKTRSNANEVFLNSVSGEVSAKLTKVDELEISTVSGEFDGDLQLNAGGSIKMSSVSGDLDLTLNKDIQASFKLQTNAGGRLINNLTDDTVQKSKYGPGAKLNFETGNGDASVKATTVSGRIKISGK